MFDTYVISLQATYIKTDLHSTTESCRDVRASMQRDKVTYSLCVLCAIAHWEEVGTAADMAIGHVLARGPHQSLFHAMQKKIFRIFCSSAGQHWRAGRGRARGLSRGPRVHRVAGGERPQGRPREARAARLSGPGGHSGPTRPRGPAGYVLCDSHLG